MMEREEEKPKAFKVDDRRRFSSEGDLKPEFRETAEATAPAPEQPAAAPGGAPPRTEAAAEEHSHAHDRRHQHDTHGAEEDDHHHTGEQIIGEPHDHFSHADPAGAAEITFGTFLVGLSTQALMLLGDIPDPQSGRPQQDLVAAQQLIDIIGMLEQKTRGNLDREEAQLIDAVLYELRMKYVERARTPR
jgi:hypothetical protein